MVHKLWAPLLHHKTMVVGLPRKSLEATGPYYHISNFHFVFIMSALGGWATATTDNRQPIKASVCAAQPPKVIRVEKPVACGGACQKLAKDG